MRIFIGALLGLLAALVSAFVFGAPRPAYVFSQSTNEDRAIGGTDATLPTAHITVTRQGRIVARLRVVMRDCAIEKCWTPDRAVNYVLIVETPEVADARMSQ